MCENSPLLLIAHASTYLKLECITLGLFILIKVLTDYGALRGAELRYPLKLTGDHTVESSNSPLESILGRQIEVPDPVHYNWNHSHPLNE